MPGNFAEKFQNSKNFYSFKSYLEKNYCQTSHASNNCTEKMSVGHSPICSALVGILTWHRRLTVSTCHTSCHFSFIFSKCPKHFKVLYFIISTIPYFIQPYKTIFPHTHSLFSLSSILFIAQPPFKMTSFHCWDPSSRPFTLFHIQVPFAYASVSTVMLSGSILFFFFILISHPFPLL